MMGRCERSHHLDPRSLADGIVGELDVGDTEFHHHIERVGAKWELNCVGGEGFTPVKTIEERLCLGVDQLRACSGVSI